MKKSLLPLLASAALSLSAFAQGTITFYNNGIARPFTTDAAGNRTYTYDPNVDGATTYYPPSSSGGYGSVPGRPLISPDGSTYRAGIFLSGGPSGAVGVGAGFTAGLFLSSDLATPLATTPFRANNTFEVFASNVPVALPPGHPVGSSQDFFIRVWETGKTYDTSSIRGQASFRSGPLGGPVPGQPDVAPASLLGFNGFMIVAIPEPSTVAFSILGAAALLRRPRTNKKN
jgi:hypothetical protein